ncbi:MAG: hypothetical protein AUJ28_00685 [Parcubacteria group bacterium CG1_02_37_51]|nr:MAG: hypothetical protein AUJ28_00685 [Parcubacteria group bacterium CG1_02_37_51]PIY93799.1 MAG: hypothetical protein COY67_03535 [Candidatus Komeilibacteria bacterium CG_4_10_14_0_8_um_filter_37_78]
MLLFPFYFAELNMRYHSPQLLEYLLSNNIDIVFGRWGGTIASLPDNEKCLIRFSKTNQKDWPTILQKCYQLGHIPFHEDYLLNINGQRQDNLIPIIQKYLIPHTK